jgi:hypothetical protein
MDSRRRRLVTLESVSEGEAGQGGVMGSPPSVEATVHEV